MSELLRIRGLCKSFGRKRVLQDFDLTVESGRVYGLLGRNGEGKTTLARILMGVIPADKGEILYKGRRISYGQNAFKRDFGYVPEDEALEAALLTGGGAGLSPAGAFGIQSPARKRSKPTGR